VAGTRIAVVVPVSGSGGTLRPLADRLSAVLPAADWRLRLVIDAAPAATVQAAHELAAADPRVAVTGVPVRVGKPAAMAAGLAAEPAADVWICLDGDLGDPPEVVPLMLDRWARGDVAAVFAVPCRHGPLLSRVPRRVVARLSGLPREASGFVAIGPLVRNAVVEAARPVAGAARALAGRPVAGVRLPRRSWRDRLRRAQP
jgi:glycosyltransferase involved in cell wall biosynthesis